MIIATTPTHTFTLPFDPGGCDIIIVTYSQDNRKVLEKNKSDCTIYSANNKFSVTLSQEDTKLFSPGDCYVQITCRQNGTVMKSKPELLFVDSAQNEEILS